MAKPISMLQGARAFARDYPRDAMPKGYLWNVNDFVPTIIDAELTGRGGWVWASQASSQDWSAGILATFTGGEQLLATSGATLYRIDLSPPYGLTSVGACPVGRQNPTQLLDQTLWCEQNGAHAPYIATPTATAATSAPSAKVSTAYRSRFVTGGVPGQEDAVWFSQVNDGFAAWDANSFIRTSGPVTGLAALRSVILVFHPGSVERIRGTIPPYTGDGGNSDMSAEPLFGQAGLNEPKSIAYWQNNIIFADEHGVHMTDGAVIRNLVQQGGIQSYWRPLYGTRIAMSAAVFLDYYIVSIVQSGGSITLVCDLNKRQWFKFTNTACVAMWDSGGTIGMERLWGAISGTNRLARLSPMFFPAFTGATIQDDNGVAVLPTMETAWYRMAAEGRKRVRFHYLSYDVRTAAAPPTRTNGVLDVGYITSPQATSYTDAGALPSTFDYSRFRLPIGKAPYGIGFQVKQLLPTTVTRVYDLQIDAHIEEPSRV